MSEEEAFRGLDRRVRDAVYDHVFPNDGGEVGGVLVGTVAEDDAVIVTGSIAALDARGSRASLTFTHEAWATVHDLLERDHPGKQIVGWYHSHPGFGIFLSKHDMFIHQNFFSAPHQIAYVVDPHAGSEGIFGWRDGQVVKFSEQPTPRAGTLSDVKSSDDNRDPGIGILVALVVVVALGGGAGHRYGDVSEHGRVPSQAAQRQTGERPGLATRHMERTASSGAGA